MFELNTPRLKIIPLNIEQLELLKESRELFEKKMGLAPCEDYKLDDRLEKEIEGAWKFWIEMVKKNPFNYTWFTRWEIILKEENKNIGTCGFKGMPNHNGEVEIGYMLNPKYHNKGYMTEVISEVVRYLFMHRRVKAVIAETPIDNLPSHKVLIKNGFKMYKEIKNNFWWRLEKKQKETD